ncbi:hypothetical protein NLM27_26045 [Bradyrhizobium sp. CCGB12]|uniref:hypothetical protein n=1 Tax=Bradyrhizobium sp. CCGB12 TaxID=2949632 RepID=UPI0020B424EF|nr:hypothetical protein [Bradyrhizobium sp. CCGB12]MCP3392235.1 hypothetical protein [Bradyrhizobium sp. CCGB12]
MQYDLGDNIWMSFGREAYDSRIEITLIARPIPQSNIEGDAIHSTRRVKPCGMSCAELIQDQRQYLTADGSPRRNPKASRNPLNYVDCGIWQ